MSLIKPKNTRQNFQHKVAELSKVLAENEVIVYGMAIMKAGISPTTAAAILEVNEKTVRRWFLGETRPRRSDMRELAKFTAKVMSALESGALPKRGATLSEIIEIVNSQKELVVATEI